MAMLPLATRTDTYEALRKTDAREADIEIFLASLRAEHNKGAAQDTLAQACKGIVSRRSSGRGRGWGQWSWR